LGRKYKARAVITIELGDRAEAESIFNSLRPESKHPAGHRSLVRLERDGRRLRLDFQSTDTTALRASMNSFLRFVLACKRVLSEMRALQK